MPKHFKETYTADAELAQAATAQPAAGVEAPLAAASVSRTGSSAGSSKKRSHAGLILGLVIALLGAAYVCGSIYFSSHYLPNTYYGNDSVALAETDTIQRLVKEENDSYELTVSRDDFAFHITGADIGLAADASEVDAQAKKLEVNPWTWPAEILGERRVDRVDNATYDSSKLEQLVTEAVDTWNETAEPPSGAQVSYDNKEKKFEVSAGNPGTQIRTEALLEVATKAIDERRDTAILDDSALAAVIANDQLQAVADQGNKMLNLEIPILVNGEVSYRTSPDDIVAWLLTDDSNNLYIDMERLHVWVDDVLSPAINYTDTLYEWHTYTYTNSDTIAARVNALSEEPVEADMFAALRIPEESEGARERGRHIDVNISTQYARFYDADGNIFWESFVVTGEADGKHNTVTGTFQIYAKERDRVLIGDDEDHDGEPDYESHVDYWMPFYGGYGLHDAVWRSSFGGEIYGYAGSHGCVNLPHEKAAELFGLVNIGDTVVVHK